MNLEKAKLIDGWILDEELVWLATIAENSSSILELGSFLGKSTRALCDNTKGTVCTVDLWEQTDGGLEAKFPEIYASFVDNVRDLLISHKLSYYKNTTNYAIKRLKEEERKFDFIFIDADHRYEQVKKDILGCKELLMPNGIISGHDYNWEGVKKAVDEIFPVINLCSNIWWTK